MDAPRSLQQAILFFSDYANCHQAVSEIRWPDGVVRCPHCGSDNVSYLEKAHVWKGYGNHAKAKFSLKGGTVFEDYELAQALGVTQKTAWFMLSRLRLALQSKYGGRITSI